jgi:hypothetical protein
VAQYWLQIVAHFALQFNRDALNGTGTGSNVVGWPPGWSLAASWTSSMSGTVAGYAFGAQSQGLFEHVQKNNTLMPVVFQVLP